MRHQGPRSRVVDTTLGAGLTVHFAFLIWVKISTGVSEDVWWLSHVCLALTAAGLLVGSHRLITAALIAVCGPHLIWLADFACLLWSGSSPWGVTAYFPQAPLVEQLATSHHFYLLPMLFGLCLSQRGQTRVVLNSALGVAAAMVVMLTVYSRVMLPSASNVNYAFSVMPSVDLAILHWTNGLVVWWYMVLINVWVVGTMSVPVWALLHLRVRAKRQRPPVEKVAPAGVRRACAGFSIVETVVLLVIFAVLAGVAAPVVMDYQEKRHEAADVADVEAVNHALLLFHNQNRARDAAPRLWVTTLDDVERLLPGHHWPDGLRRNAGIVFDRRGFEYGLAPETAEAPASLAVVVIPPR